MLQQQPLKKQPSASSIIDIFCDGIPETSTYGVVDFDDNLSMDEQQLATATKGSRNSLAIPVSERRKFFERVAEYNTFF